MPTFTRARFVGCHWPWVALWVGLLLTSGLPVAQAYFRDGRHWPSNQPIILDLQLGSPGKTLLDGSTSWNEVAEAAMDVWNPYLGDGVQFEAIEDASKPQRDDGKNSVFFATSAFGEDFGEDVLAVTFTHYDSSTAMATESDVVFNSAERFDSYRGKQKTDSGGKVYDLRRVAIHEFGHVLGLNHPLHGENAIMAPFISDVDTVQADDIAGVQSIYGPVVPLIIGSLSASGTTVGNFAYQILAIGPPSSYAASGLPPGLEIDGATGRISGTPSASGTYSVQISATNKLGTDSATLVVVISAPPVITSSLAVTAPLGQSFSYAIIATREPTRYAATGLPDTLRLDPATGVISGYPAVPGTFPVVLSATNSIGTGTATLVLKVTLTDSSLVTVHNFQYVDGRYPCGSLIQAADGNFYGTTTSGGTSDNGTVYKMTPDGTLTTFYSFSGTDGATPNSGVIQGRDGNFYGSTYFGGANGFGTVFRLTPDGTLTTLHSFARPEGGEPAGLVQASDGNIYGVTTASGIPQFTTTSIFKLTPAGVYSVIYSYNDRANETMLQSLLQATDGNFYGATQGTNRVSPVLFRCTPDGHFTVVRQCPEASGFSTIQLFQASDGDLYGTAQDWAPDYSGMIFKMTLDGALTMLHSFSTAEGTSPSRLMQASDGNFYGTAYSGGDVSGAPAGFPLGFAGMGTIFAITPEGNFATLYIFDGASGANPSSGLIQGSDGYLYGVTSNGDNDGGTLFKKGLVAIPTYEPPVVTLTATTPQAVAANGAIGAFLLSLSKPQDHDIVITYTIKGSAINGTDYVLLKGTKKIKAGKTSKPIKIIPQGDLGGANKKTVTLTLAPGDGYTVGTTGKVKVKILAP